MLHNAISSETSLQHVLTFQSWSKGTVTKAKCHWMSYWIYNSWSYLSLLCCFVCFLNHVICIISSHPLSHLSCKLISWKITNLANPEMTINFHIFREVCCHRRMFNLHSDRGGKHYALLWQQMSPMWQGCYSSSLTVIEDRMCQNYIEAKEALESRLPPHNLL